MGAWGAIIMGFFGSLFGSLTLYWQLEVRGISLGAPFILFAAIAFAALRVLRAPGQGISPSKHAEKVISWASVGEGVGLFVAANIVINLHRPDLLLPAMAFVVGLHFLPIAFAARFRPFLWLGSVLMASSLVGFSVAPPSGGTIAGFMAAVGLWLAAFFALARDQRAKSASSPLA